MNTLEFTECVERTLALFKTIVRLRVVDKVVHPYEWTRWYYGVKEFVQRWGR